MLTAKEAVDKQTRKGDKQTPEEKPVSAHACALSVVSPSTRVGAPCLASSIRYPFSSTLHPPPSAFHLPPSFLHPLLSALL